MREKVVRSVAADRAEIGVPLCVVAISLIARAELPTQIAAHHDSYIRAHAPQRRISVVRDGVNRSQRRRDFAAWVSANIDQQVRIGAGAHCRSTPGTTIAVGGKKIVPPQAGTKRHSISELGEQIELAVVVRRKSTGRELVVLIDDRRSVSPK